MPARRRTARTAPIDMPAMAPADREYKVVEAEKFEDVDAAVAAVLEAADVLVGKPEVEGVILNAGEKLTLLELESSVILNWYC